MTVQNPFLQIEHSIRKELSIAEVADILGRTVRRDWANKCITFLVELSAYSDDSQLNQKNASESSTGKSYLPLEIALLFPPADIKWAAYASPTSFFHDYATKDVEEKEVEEKDAQGLPILAKRKVVTYRIDLERKILIFLDMPHDELLKKLRPLLSHDKKELEYFITDKSGKGELRTKHIIMRGFPAVIFCTGFLTAEDQEATRLLVLSPEISNDKIREAIVLRAFREGDKEGFEKWLAEDERRKYLMQRIREIRDLDVKRIQVPGHADIAEAFIRSKTKMSPRLSRDISRIISLVKAHALLNAFTRAHEEGVLYANDRDVEAALRLYGEIDRSQEAGIAPYVFEMYEKVFRALGGPEGADGFNRKQIHQKYFEVYGKFLGKTLDKQVLPALEAAGMITSEQSSKDGRVTDFYLTSKGATPSSGGILLKAWQTVKRERDGAFAGFWMSLEVGGKIPPSRGASPLHQGP